MELHTLDADRRLNLLVDIHRDLSLVDSAYDLLHGFLNQVRSLSGFEYMLNISTLGLEAGWFRVMNRVALPDAGLTREEVTRRSLWPDLSSAPLQRSTILGELMIGVHPRLALDCDFTRDDEFADELGDFRSALAVPIFISGEPGEWVILLRRDSITPELPDVRTAMQACNLLSHAVKERRLSDEVHRLNEELTRKITEVARVQRSILVDEPPATPGLEIAVDYEPCDAAGGDYYDFQQFSEHRLGVVIADVSGHGPAASVVMAMLRTVMGAFRVSGHPYDAVVRDVNRLLYEALDAGTFVTAFFLHMDTRTGETAFANCGHPSPLVRRADGSIEELSEGGMMPLAIVPDLEGQGGQGQLRPGDTVLLYTDGITEAFSERREMFGEQRLRGAMTAAGSEPRGLLDAVNAAVSGHTNGRALDDDRCLVALRFQGV